MGKRIAEISRVLTAPLQNVFSRDVRAYCRRQVLAKRLLKEGNFAWVDCEAKLMHKRPCKVVLQGVHMKNKRMEIDIDIFQ